MNFAGRTERILMGNGLLEFDNNSREYYSRADDGEFISISTGCGNLKKVSKGNFDAEAMLREIDAEYSKLLRSDPDHLSKIQKLAASLDNKNDEITLFLEADLEKALFTPLDNQID